MTRRLLNLLTALALLPCVAAIGFGAWGFRDGPDEVRLEWVGSHHAAALLSDRGALALVYSSGWPAGDWVNDRPVAVVAKPMPLSIRNGLVIELTEERITLSDGTTTATVRYQGVRTNFLYATVFAAALPAWWLVRRATRRVEPHVCARCGYDLRATPGRCPECGTIPAATSAQCSAACSTS